MNIYNLEKSLLGKIGLKFEINFIIPLWYF